MSTTAWIVLAAVAAVGLYLILRPSTSAASVLPDVASEPSSSGSSSDNRPHFSFSASI